MKFHVPVNDWWGFILPVHWLRLCDRVVIGTDVYVQLPKNSALGRRSVMMVQITSLPYQRRCSCFSLI
jgi:hypothetical protein